MEEHRDAVDTTSTMYDPLDKVALYDSHPDSDVDTFLHDQNLAFTALLAPSVAYTVLLSVLGLVGNTAVLLVYYWRFKPSVSRTYILAMGVCDLLINVLFMPTDFLETRFYATFYAAWACKLSRSVRSFLAHFSAAAVVAMAFDRQRTVCSKSLRLSKSHAFSRVRVSLILCAFASLIGTVPYSVLTGGQTVRFAESNVTGVTCSIQDRYRASLFALVYNVLLGVVFIVSVVIMGVSYGRTARFLWLYKKDKSLSRPVMALRGRLSVKQNKRNKRQRRESVGFRAGNVQMKPMESIPVGLPPCTALITGSDIETASSFIYDDCSTYFSVHSDASRILNAVVTTSPASDPEAKHTTDYTTVTSNQSSAKSDEEPHFSKIVTPSEVLDSKGRVSSEAKYISRNSTYPRSSSEPNGETGSLNQSITEGSKNYIKITSSQALTTPATDLSDHSPAKPSKHPPALGLSKQPPAKHGKHPPATDLSDHSPAKHGKHPPATDLSDHSPAKHGKHPPATDLSDHSPAKHGKHPPATDLSDHSPAKHGKHPPATDLSDHSPAKHGKHPPATDLSDHSPAKHGKIKGLSSNENGIPLLEPIPRANGMLGLSSSKPTKVECPSTNEKVTSPPAKPGGLEEPNSDQNVAPSPEVNNLLAHPSNLNKVKRPSSYPAKKISARTTLMMFVLTVMYVVNYLPYMVMVILDSIDKAPLHLDINVRYICYKSFFLNSVVNPFVYGFFNPSFRRECRAFFCSRQ